MKKILISLVIKNNAKNPKEREIIAVSGFETNNLTVQFNPEGNLKLSLPENSKYKTFDIPENSGYTLIRPDPEYATIEFEIEVEEKTNPDSKPNPPS